VNRRELLLMALVAPFARMVLRTHPKPKQYAWKGMSRDIIVTDGEIHSVTVTNAGSGYGHYPEFSLTQFPLRTKDGGPGI